MLSLLVVACSSQAEPTDWALTEEDGRNLTIVANVGISGCHVVDAVTVHETETEVNLTVTVAESRLPWNCTNDVLDLERIDVELDQPLADRELEGCILGDEEYFHPDTADTSSRRDTCREIINV